MKIYYNTDSCAVEISARTLCELALDIGDLDSGRDACLDALEDEVSARAYQKVIAKDKSYGKIDETLVNTSLYGNIYFTVSARAARISFVDGLPRVDVIKSIKKPRKKGFSPDVWTLSYLKILPLRTSPQTGRTGARSHNEGYVCPKYRPASPLPGPGPLPFLPNRPPGRSAG